ncbi:MAG TPA: OmpH family outer membrane protein [Chitinophagaceae bacterium]|nr:OmpH family outer membrane protein [Chitinophagaceae bacterium]
MKNGLVIWNVVLTLIAGYLLIVQFSKKPGSAAAKHAVNDSSSSQNSVRIAYFEMDSVEAHYEKVKDVQAEIQNQEKEYSNGLSQLDLTYRKKIQEYQQKGSSMTQADYEKAQMDLKQLEDRLKVTKQDLDQKYQDFVQRRNLSLKKTIEDYIAKYNQDRKYSYIFVYEPGLFYYKDTLYNITSDVVKGLNEEYKKSN